MHSDNLQTRFGHLDHRSELLVAFPNPSQNIVRRNVEFTLAQIQEKRKLRDGDQSRMRESMAGLHDLVQRLERQFSVPDQLPAETVAEREKKTLEIAEELILQEHVPAFPPSDGRPVGNTGLFIDSQNMRRMEIMNKLVEMLSVEVGTLRAEHERVARILDEKDNRIMDMEAMVHGQQLKHIALEQLVVTLKKKAQGQSTATYNFTAIGGGKSTVSEAVAAEAKKVIDAERLKIISETEQRMYVSVGEAQGPLYDPAMVLVHIHSIKQIRERLAPAIFHSVVGKFRTQIRTVAEVCDGYEFRCNGDDHFAFAFQTPKAALRFALQVQTHMLFGVEWETELDSISVTQLVKDVSGKLLFRGPRVVVAVHHGESRGVLDPFTGLSGFEGHVFDTAARMERVGKPGVIIVSNKVVKSPEVQQYLTSEGQGFVSEVEDDVARAVCPGSNDLHLFNVTPAVTKPRLALVESIKFSLREALPVEPTNEPLPASGAIVALRAEGFCALEDDCGHHVFSSVCRIYKKTVMEQMLHSMTSRTKPVILRYDGDDRFLILFERTGDALHFLITLQDSFFEVEWPAEFLAWGCGSSDGKLLRGVRLQSALHWCSSVTDTGMDPFTDMRRAKTTETEYTVGLSLLARGGETIISEAAMEARLKESPHELDIRCRHVTFLKIPKKVTFKQTQAETTCYVAMSSRFFGRSEAFRKLPPAVPIALPAVPIGDVTIATVGISGALKLVATNYPAYMDARTRLDSLAAAAAQRFGAVKCLLPDPTHDVAVSLFAFWSPKDAVCFASHLHEVAMTGFFPSGLDDPVFTQQVFKADDSLLFRGFRLRIGLHRSDKIHIIPASAQYGGPDVAESVFLAAAASPGHTLVTSEVLEGIPESIKMGPELLFTSTKIGDPFGVSKPGKVNVVLPHAIAFRFPGTPLHTADPVVDGLRRLALACKTAPREFNATGGAEAKPSATAEPSSPASPVAVQGPAAVPSQQFYPLAQPCEDSVAFASIRIPNCAALVERSPQGMEAGLSMYLAAVRDATKGFDGHEICNDVDAVFVLFSDLVNAVRWASHLQESLMQLRWPEQILSLEAAKEVKTSVKGSTRSIVAFRGLRVLVAIDYGKPNFFMDTTAGKVIYYGAVPLRAVGTAQWGHAGQIVLTEFARVGLTAPELAAAERLPQHAIASVGPRSVTDEDTVELFLFTPHSLSSRHYPSFPETPKHERFIALANDIAEAKRTIHSQEHTAGAVFHAPALEKAVDPLQPGNTQVIEALINDLHDNVVVPAARLFGGRVVLTVQSALACTFPSCQAAYACACFINMKLLAIAPAAGVPPELIQSMPNLVPSVVNEKAVDPETGATLWNGIRIATTIDATTELRTACEFSAETEGGDIVLSQRAIRELDETIRPVAIRWLHHDWA
jgi:hypothetical protein